MSGEDFYRYANDGLLFLQDRHHSHLDMVNNVLHVMARATMEEMAPRESKNGIAYFDSTPGHQTVPEAIVPEILEFLPLSPASRLFYHEYLTTMWSEIPQAKTGVPVWNPDKAIIRTHPKSLTLCHADSTPLITEHAVRDVIGKVFDTMQMVCGDIFDDLQCFMVRHYKRSVEEKIDAEWRVEMDAQNEREYQEELARQQEDGFVLFEEENIEEQNVVEENARPLSSSSSSSEENEGDSSDSTDSELTTPPNTPEKSVAILATSNYFDWADDAIEEAAQQGHDTTIKHDDGTSVSFNNDLMQEVLQFAPTSSISPSSGSDLQMASVVYEEDECDISLACPAYRGDVDMTDVGNDGDLSSAPTLSAVACFGTRLTTIYEEEESDISSARPSSPVMDITDTDTDNSNDEFSSVPTLSAVADFEPQLTTIPEEGVDSEMSSSSSIASHADVDMDADNNGGNFTSTPQLSAIDGFKPQMATIFEEVLEEDSEMSPSTNNNGADAGNDDISSTEGAGEVSSRKVEIRDATISNATSSTDTPEITARNDAIVAHFHFLSNDKYNSYIVERFFLDPAKYFCDEDIEKIVERVAGDVYG